MIIPFTPTKADGEPFPADDVVFTLLDPLLQLPRDGPAVRGDTAVGQ